MKHLLSLLCTLPLFGAASVTLNNSSSTATNYPLQFAQPFVDGEIATCPKVVFDGSALTTQADVKQTYPDGSVKHAILAVVIPSVTNGAHTITYVNQACSNTPLTKTQMLDPSYDFGAQMLLTNSSTITTDGRVMLSAWNGTTDDFNITSPVHLWTSGQVAQTVLIALHGNTLLCNGHQCSTYDVGFDANKVFRPIFHATFFPATHQVHVRFIGEISNSAAIENQTFSLVMKTGNASPTSVYTKASFQTTAGTRWTKDFWIGGTPPSTITLTPNLTYLRTTKFTPFYDTSVALDSSTATAVCTAWSGLSSANKDIGGPGNWTKGMTTTGSRPDIGIYESWVADWLFDGRACLRDAAFGNADLMASWPAFYREGSSGKVLNRSDTPGSSTGMGKVVAISGRPTGCWNPQFFNYNANASDSITTVGTISYQGWDFDAAHTPEGPQIQYVLTGDYWYLENEMFWASNYAGQGYKSQYYRGPLGTEGSLFHQQLRGMAWNLRTFVHTAFIIPDAMPEKTYFTQLIADSVAIEEGSHNLTNGFYNGNTMWTQGRNVWAPSGADTAFDSNGVVSILHQYTHGDPGSAANDYGICSTYGAGTPCIPPTTSEAESFYESDYLMTSLGRCKEMGYKCDYVLSWSAVLYTGMLTDSGFNPYILDIGRLPTYKTCTPTPCTTAQFATFAELKTGVIANWQNRTGYATKTDPDGYLAYATAAMSYMTGEPNGQTSWNFLKVNGVSSATSATDPKWLLAPNVPQACNIVPTSLPSGTVSVAYSQALTGASCGSGTLTWTRTVGSLPGGLSGCNGVAGAACTISGTPSTISGSPFSFTIQVSDGGSNSATQAFSVTINPSAGTAPTITSTSPITTGVVGTAYAYTFNATGTTPITWSATGLPHWAVLNASTGAISGTPDAAATTSIAVTASNSAGSAGPTTFSLPVLAPPLITTTSPLPTFTNGTPVSLQLVASGSATITWSASGLPGWASLSSGGLLTGTPNANATTVPNFTATNSVGANTIPLSMTVKAAGVAPVLTTSTLTVGVVGQQYTFQLTATGDVPQTWAVTGLPAGLTLDANTGIISGVPISNATSTIAVTVTNAVNHDGPHNLSLIVAQIIQGNVLLVLPMSGGIIH